MPTTIQQITAFHALQQNAAWPTSSEDQISALAKALMYQRAFYPVRPVLTDSEQIIFNDAIALLALEMAVDAPQLRATQPIKKLKEQSSSGAAIETEYEASTSEPYPLIAAMLAPLAPRPVSSPSVRFSRLVP